MTVPVGGADIAVGDPVTAAFLDALNDNSLITDSGSVTFTPTAGAWSTTAVTFSATFSTPPIVLVSLLVAGSGTISYYGLGSAPTTTGCTVGVNRSAAVSTTLYWVAVLT